MKELVLNTSGVPALQDYELPALAPGFVRVECHFGAPKHGTEMTCVKDDPFREQYYDDQAHIFKMRTAPQESNKGHMGLGNMWVGLITEMASDVTGFKLGQRVAGYGNLKPVQTVKAASLLTMPDSMTWKQAVCFDPLQFALGGIRDGGVRMGDRVLISGLGAIGLMAAQAARLAGASFVAVSDPIEIRRKAALENGADIAFDPMKEDFGLLLREHTGNRGVDVVIETSANYKAIEQGLRSLAYGGTLACVGWLKECHVPIHLGREGHFNQQKIVFSRACSDPNLDYPRWSFDRICTEGWGMLCKGIFDCENIVAPVVNFEDCAKGYLHYIVEQPSESVKMGVKF